jgi:hypothetical protein
MRLGRNIAAIPMKNPCSMLRRRKTGRYDIDIGGRFGDGFALKPALNANYFKGIRARFNAYKFYFNFTPGIYLNVAMTWLDSI